MQYKYNINKFLLLKIKRHISLLAFSQVHLTYIFLIIKYQETDRISKSFQQLKEVVIIKYSIYSKTINNSISVNWQVLKLKK